MPLDTKKEYMRIAQSACDAPFRAQQKNTELAMLLELLHLRQPKRILEIGVFHGGTIKAWTQVADPEAIIVGIDLPKAAYGGGFNAQQAKLITGLAKHKQKILLLPFDSHAQSTFDIVAKQAPFDFLFIDADHTYEGAKTDFELYSPLVAEGGIIALHDVVPHTLYPEVGVYKLWNEIKFSGANVVEYIDYEYVTDHGLWAGIGVIFK